MSFAVHDRTWSKFLGGQRLRRAALLLAALALLLTILPSANTTWTPGAAADDTDDVLVIQDVLPWDIDAFNGELTDQGRDYTIVGSDELDDISLDDYVMVVLASSQEQSYYDNVFPGGEVHSKLPAFVEDGGIISAQLTDRGWGGGNWSGSSFIAGLQHEDNTTDELLITDPDHPVITGPDEPIGNTGLVRDEGERNDLDGWNSSAHAYFTDLPDDTTVIITDEQERPVKIEYPYGNGRVLASVVTSEWMWGGGGQGEHEPRKQLLANELAFDFELATGERPGAISGVVTDADSDEPIEGATVHTGDESVTTEADGAYILDDLEPGDYSVTATAPDYASATATATVVADETTTVDFALDPTPCPEWPDVSEDNEHYDHICALALDGILLGYPNGAFGPGESITRGQVASVLARTSGLEGAAPAEPSFSDIAGNTHEADIEALAAAGIIEGFEDGRFRPGAAIRRDQAASLIGRWLEVEPSADGRFDDVPAANVHAGNVNALAELGVIEGKTATRFQPSLDIRRDQFAAIVNRAR